MANFLPRLVASCNERPLCLIRVLIGAACLLVLVVVWHDLIVSARDNEQVAFERVRVEAGIQVRAASDTMQASIDRFDFALRTASTAALAGPDALALQGRIVTEALPADLVLQLFHIGADGYLSYSSLGAAPRNYLGDRDYFKTLASDEGDRLVISNPVLGRLTNKWSIQIARAVKRDGRFDGVVSIAVSPEVWMVQLRRYRLSSRDTLALLSADGHYLLRTLDSADYFGKQLPPDRPFLLQREQPEGDFVAPGNNDGVERLFSWIRLPSGLIMASGIALDDALADTRAFNRWSLIRTIFLSCLILLATGALIVALARYEGVVRALGERERHYRKVLDNMAEGILVIDPDNRIISINPAFSTITGYREHEVQGRTPEMLSPTHAGARNLGAIIRSHAGDRWADDFDGLHRSGDTYTGHALLSTVRDAAGVQRIVLLSDVTDSRRKNAEIWRQANYDPLTGLPNRALMTDRLERMIGQARRHPARVVVLFIDLDQFKPVNDRFGHELGDLLLREVARRLKDLFRDEDTVARIGGDEFVVLLSGDDAVEAAERSCARIVDSLSRPFVIHEQVLEISCSVGIARFPDDAADAAALLHQADLAMYRAKERGRATWSV
ncbi:MAG: diguanylate cyclase [Betaproteobacteria bacterium HGW-Betaproteobacteria-21]|nr:MAG: diguanylate cyclase [Betaproteobacteria bacterium HGW-Betaproteobacteria-21]